MRYNLETNQNFNSKISKMLIIIVNKKNAGKLLNLESFQPQYYQTETNF